MITIMQVSQTSYSLATNGGSIPPTSTNNNNNNNMNITQDEFDAYEDVRESGVTNMFDVSTVSDYSGLNREQIMAIMKNYSELNEKYGN